MAYKIINGYVILEPSMLPKINLQRPRQCNEAKVGTINQLKEPQLRLDVVKSTFFFSTPKLWNMNVTPSQAKAPSMEAFKGHFEK